MLSTLVVRASVAVAALVVSIVAAISIGAVDLPPMDVIKSLSAHLFGTSPPPALNDTIVWDIRAPRVMLALLVGAGLSVAGASFQGVFRNPLADPYLLGSAAGAGVGATIAIGYLQEPALLTPFAFIGAIGGVLASWVVGSAAGGLQSSAIMVLAGVSVMSFLTAVQTLLQQQRADSLQQVYSWILGQLSTGGWTATFKAAPGIIVGTIVLIAMARRLDLFELGDDKARTMGINVNRSRAIIILAAALVTASAVAASGLIGFVGLIVPHIVRRVFGASNRVVIPMSVVVGGTFLIATDAVARTVIAPAELPIGVITAFFGAPFFAWLLYATRTRWS